MRGTQTPIIDYEDAATSTKLEGRSVKVKRISFHKELLTPLP